METPADLNKGHQRRRTRRNAENIKHRISNRQKNSL